MTKLDLELLELANKDPNRFLKMIGSDKWNTMKMCYLRQENHSYGQIINKMGELEPTIDAVRWACKNCEM